MLGATSGGSDVYDSTPAHRRDDGRRPLLAGLTRMNPPRHIGETMLGVATSGGCDSYESTLAHRLDDARTHLMPGLLRRHPL